MHRRSKSHSVIIWVTLLYCLAGYPHSAKAAPESSPIPHITAKVLQPKGVTSLTREVWRYRAGDDSTLQWTTLEFDDSAWDTIRPGRREAVLSEGTGQGAGVFRLRFSADTALYGIPVALTILQYGAMEIYLDGKRIYSFGQIGSNDATTKPYLLAGDHFALVFDNKPYHVLAVRYAAYNTFVRTYKTQAYQTSFIFILNLREYQAKQNEVFDLIALDVITRLIPAVILGILALLHFIVFIRYRQDKSNLAASIVMTVMAIGLFCRFIAVMKFAQPHRIESIVYDRIGEFVGIAGLSCSVALVYILCNSRLSQYHYKILGVIAILVVLYCSAMFFGLNPVVVEIIGFIYFSLAFWTSFQALKVAAVSERKNIWIVSVGMNTMLGLSAIVQIDKSHFLLIPKLFSVYGSPYELAMSFAMLTFPFSVTVYMALEIARQNIELDAAVHARTQSLEHSNASLSAANEEVQRQMVIQSEQSREIEEKNTELQENLETLRRTQTQLAQAEKMASLGTLVAGVAHELNTPIGVAVTAASTLHGRTKAFAERYKEGGLKKSELEGYIETAEIGADLTLRNLERAANLIQSFKQVAVDQTSDQKRRFNLHQYVQGVITSLEPKWKTTNHRVEIECDGTIELETYPGAIAQIITNLIENSLLHGFQGYTESGVMRIVAEKDNDRITITYSDNGRGIPSEILPRIFDPFFTTKQAQGGTGLGMHIVYNLVTQKLGGEIRCSSESGVGTTFTLSLPQRL